MIIDTIENAHRYPFGLAWERAFEFLKGLNAGFEDKKYSIEGDDIFALVMSYDTKPPESLQYEAHEKYIDIQTVIVGSEGFECAFLEDLQIATNYDEGIEAAFYKRKGPGRTRVDVSSGIFVMLHPADAHLPGLIVGDKAQRVKKVVVKIKKELLGF